VVWVRALVGLGTLGQQGKLTLQMEKSGRTVEMQAPELLYLTRSVAIA